MIIQMQKIDFSSIRDMLPNVIPMIQSGNRIALADAEGKLHIIEHDEVSCLEDYRIYKVCSADNNGNFICMTYDDSYILICEDGEIKYIDEDVAKLGENVVMQDHIMWAWNDGKIKWLCYDGSFHVHERTCDKPIAVCFKNQGGVFITENTWELVHCSWSVSVNRIFPSIPTSCESSNQRICLVVDGVAVHFEEGRGYPVYGSSNALMWLDACTYVTANGKVKCYDGDSYSQTRCETSHAALVNYNTFLGHENRIILTSENVITFPAKIHKMFKTHSFCIVVLKDFTVHAVRLYERAYYDCPFECKELTYFRNVKHIDPNRKNVCMKNARKI